MKVFDFDGSHIEGPVQPPAADRPMGWTLTDVVPSHWLGDPSAPPTQPLRVSDIQALAADQPQPYGYGPGWVDTL